MTDASRNWFILVASRLPFQNRDARNDWPSFVAQRPAKTICHSHIPAHGAGEHTGFVMPLQ
jgi:hypothetical protein